MAKDIQVLRKIAIDEVDTLINFYNYVICNTPDMNIYGRWKIGLHPTESEIREYINKGALYALVENDIIVGGMAVTMSQGNDYHLVSWGEKLDDNEAVVIHILAVNPMYQGRGIGKKMIDEAIKLAKDGNKKVIRLDALASNTPARHLYEEKGFVYRDVQKLYAENTGWTDFYFFELLL